MVLIHLPLQLPHRTGSVTHSLRLHSTCTAPLPSSPAPASREGVWDTHLQWRDECYERQKYELLYEQTLQQPQQQQRKHSNALVLRVVGGNNQGHGTDSIIHTHRLKGS